MTPDEPTSRTPWQALQKGAVFGGVALALAGTAMFVRGASGFEAAIREPLTSAESMTLAVGLLLLGGGVSLATSTRFGKPGILAGLGVPALALGLASLGAGLFAPETVETVSLATASAREAAGQGSPVLVALGIVSSMVGLTLLLVFSMRAQTIRR